MLSNREAGHVEAEDANYFYNLSRVFLPKVQILLVTNEMFLKIEKQYIKIKSLRPSVLH